MTWVLVLIRGTIEEIRPTVDDLDALQPTADNYIPL